MTFIIDGDRGAGHRHFLSGVLKLHRNGLLIQHHAIRRFGFHDFIFAQVQLRAGGSTIRRSGQGIHNLACAVTQGAIRRNNVFRSPDLKFGSFQAGFCVDRLIPVLQLSFLNLHGREHLAGFLNGDGSFLRGVFFLRNDQDNAIFADCILRCHVKEHGIGIQDISIGRFDLNNGIAFPKRKYLRRDEPAFLIGHKLGMLLYFRIGGGHGDQVAIGIINFKGGSGVGDGFSRFRIHLDDLQIGFKLSVVDEVLIGLSMFVNRDRKGGHILGAIPALGLFHNIFPIGELLALSEAIGITGQDIPLIRIGGIVAACGLQVNLEFGPFLRRLDLSAAIVRVLDDGNIALDHIFAYAYWDGVMLNGKVPGISTHLMDGFIQQVARAWLNFTNCPVRAANVLCCRKGAIFIGGIGVNEFFTIIETINSAG